MKQHDEDVYCSSAIRQPAHSHSYHSPVRGTPRAPPTPHAAFQVAYPISYLGIVLVLTVLKCSDSLTAVIITSCRKAVTVVLSFLLFSKPFSVNYVYGGILVFLAIWLTVTGQRERKASATDVVPIRLPDVSLKDFASLRPGKVHVV